MKILIIGGNGYIGSALYKHLKLNNYDVDSVDLCLFGPDFGYSNIINYNNINISLYSHIVLLAAHSSVKMCEYNTHNAWLNNVDYFYNLCEKLDDNQVLIYASSASIYGRSNKLSQEIDINISPINTYDLTKITIDLIANKFINCNKKIIGLRFGTVNGGSPNIRSDLMINSMYISYKKTNKIYIKNPKIYRAILGLSYLVLGIEKIITTNNSVVGQFNFNSFNSSVDLIAKNVQKILSCDIIYLPNDNYTEVYDFKIDNKKFMMSYDFKFTANVSTILTELENTLNNYNIDSRNDDRLFNSYI